MIESLKRGWKVLTQHSKLWLIVALVVILPALFIVSFQKLNQVATANVTTVQINRISAFHDVLLYLEPALIADVKSRHLDIREIVLLQEEGGELVVTYSAEAERIGTIEPTRTPYSHAQISPGETVVFKMSRAEGSVWQAFRAIPAEANQPPRYIFTEHDFSRLDTVMNNRLQDAYLVLSFLFLFLIALAYWISRQINFEAVSRRLRSDIKERDTFMQTMVHELRAPLTAMRGYASLISESERVPAEEKQYAERIYLSTTRLVMLVNDFLEVAKIQADGLTVKKSAVDVIPIIAQALADQEASAKEKGLKLVSKIEHQTLFIAIDAKRLAQVITNLLSNAIKYTEQGDVSIALSEEVKSITVTVADTGVGMDAASQQKLFAPFVRVGTAAQQSKITGTGLGMWITKKLVEQLGGQIGVESISGVGTHVVVTLPRQ